MRLRQSGIRIQRPLQRRDGTRVIADLGPQLAHQKKRFIRPADPIRTQPARRSPFLHRPCAPARPPTHSPSRYRVLRALRARRKRRRRLNILIRDKVRHPQLSAERGSVWPFLQSFRQPANRLRIIAHTERALPQVLSPDPASVGSQRWPADSTPTPARTRGVSPWMCRGRYKASPRTPRSSCSCASTAALLLRQLTSASPLTFACRIAARPASPVDGSASFPQPPPIPLLQPA